VQEVSCSSERSNNVLPAWDEFDATNILPEEKAMARAMCVYLKSVLDRMLGKGGSK
jgi:hypothetical protein